MGIMTIERNFDETFTVKRISYSGNKGTFQTVGTFTGHIQMYSEQERVNIKEVASSSHRIWCSTDTDVETGDKIEKGSDVYSVKYINERTYGRNAHLEVYVQRNEE